MDDQILALYAKGMSTRDIVDLFKEMYDADVSATLISKVTDRVLDTVIEWQSRPLGAVYPIFYLDCIVLKIRQNKRVINKSMYLALGINMEGQKELLGLTRHDQHHVGLSRWDGIDSREQQDFASNK
jgi:transposase-like protein